MLRKRFHGRPVSAPELIYKQICARCAASHPSARGAALKAQTRQCLAALGLFIASGRERHGRGTAQTPSVPVPFPPLPPPCHLHPRGLPIV